MEFKYKLDVEVDYGSNRLATIAKNSIEVDKELRPNMIKRELVVIDSKLIVHFTCIELKLLRTATSGFFDMLRLVTDTIEQFDH